MSEGENANIPINAINGIVLGSRGDGCMDVLLVAPTSDLAFVDVEVQAVVNALHPDLLFGSNATVDAVMRAFQAKEYDLAWFACHGTEEGLELADGLLSRENLTQFLRGSSAAIFLNSCNSLGVAIDLHDELDVSVICSIVSVPDEDAYHTGSLMAGHLAAGHELRQAYDLSRPGRNRQFVFLNGSIQMSRHERLDELITMVHGVARRLDAIEQRFDERITDIEDSFGNSLNGLRHEIRGTYQMRFTRKNTVKWTLGFLIFSINILLFYSDIRHALQISAPASAIIAMMMLPVSAYLFMSGFGFSFGDRGESNET